MKEGYNEYKYLKRNNPGVFDVKMLVNVKFRNINQDVSDLYKVGYVLVFSAI